MFRFLHLSDLHIGQAKASSKKSLYEITHLNLEEDCQNWLKLRNTQKVDGILLTGDIAFSGTDDDFVDAAKLINSLREKLGDPPVFVVPGNHDIDWMKINILEYSRQQKLRADLLVDKADKFHDYLTNTKGKYEPLDKLRSFEEFIRVNGLIGGIQSTDNAQWHHDLKDNDGWQIRLHGMCSVFVSNFDDQEKQMFLGVKQIFSKALENRDYDHLVMMHHPFEWFSDKKQIESRLMSNARIVLTGHVHAAKFSTIDNVVFVGAGALNPPQYEDADYCYNWLELSYENGTRPVKIEYFPRNWSPSSQNQRFTADSSNSRFDESTNSIVDYLPSNRVSSRKPNSISHVELIVAEPSLTIESKLLLLRPELFQSLRRHVPLDRVPARGTVEQLVKDIKKSNLFSAEIFEDVRECMKTLSRISKGEEISKDEAVWMVSKIPKIVRILEPVAVVDADV